MHCTASYKRLKVSRNACLFKQYTYPNELADDLRECVGVRKQCQVVHMKHRNHDIGYRHKLFSYSHIHIVTLTSLSASDHLYIFVNN